MPTPHDLSALDDTLHMLQWLDADPYPKLIAEITGWLTAQVPGTRVEGLVAEGEPDWLTGGRRSEEDPDKVILVRTGVAFQFRVVAHPPQGEAHPLRGVLSWVGWDLDTPKPKTRLWFDVDGELAALGKDGALLERVYQES